MKRLAAAIVVLATLVAGGSTATASTRPVVLTDTAIFAPKVTIHHGDSVRWVNVGKVPHRVVSKSGAWPPFALARLASKTIRFPRAGCFPYTVDGRRAGLVAVDLGCGASRGSGGVGQTIYHYDVTIVGHAHTVQNHSGDTRQPSANGIVDLTMDWTSTYRNVAVKKISVGGMLVIGTVGGLVPGTSSTVFKYIHDRQPPLGKCDGTESEDALDSRLLLAGSHIKTGFSFRFSSELTTAAGTTLFMRITDAQKSDCNGYSDEPRWRNIGGGKLPLIVRDGVTWQDVDPLTALPVAAARTAPTLFSPLDELEHGESFTLETGSLLQAAPCHFGVLAPRCSEMFEGSLKVTFTRRR